MIAIVFKYCDDHKLPLLDLKDLAAVLRYVSQEGASEMAAYGNVSQATVGVILRKLLEIEQQGATRFFGERSFEIQDLLRTDEKGHGYVNVVRLCDIQDKPKLFLLSCSAC